MRGVPTVSAEPPVLDLRSPPRAPHLSFDIEELSTRFTGRLQVLLNDYARQPEADFSREVMLSRLDILANEVIIAVLQGEMTGDLASPVSMKDHIPHGRQSRLERFVINWPRSLGPAIVASFYPLRTGELSRDQFLTEIRAKFEIALNAIDGWRGQLTA